MAEHMVCDMSNPRPSKAARTASRVPLLSRTEIDRLASQAQETLLRRKSLQVQLKNARRKRARAVARVARLTNDDLSAVIQERIEKINQANAASAAPPEEQAANRGADGVTEDRNDGEGQD